MIEIILKDYIKKNKALFYSYTLSCILFYVLNILVTSKVYSEFFKSKDMVKNVKNVCILWVSKFVLTYIKTRLEENIMPSMLSFVRHELFVKYIKSNYVVFDDTNVTGDVKEILELSRTTRDLFIWFIQLFLPMIVIILTISMIFLYNYPIVGIVNLIFTFVNYLIIIYNYGKLQKDMEKKYEFFKRLSDKYEENLSNLMNIFLNNKIEDSIYENKKIENDFIPVAIARHQTIKALTNYLRISTYFSIVLSMGLLYQKGNREDFMNALLVYTFYIGTLESIFEDFPYYLHLFTQVRHCDKLLTDKIYYKMDMYKESEHFTNNLSNFQGNIEFRDVSFSYPIKKENHQILENLNWKIQGGDRVSLVSKSGKGKTTTMKLLLNFYKPQKGSIYLDGIDISTIDPNEIRKKINYINQKTFLINDTIINNMKYGNNKTDKEIINLLDRYDLLNIFRDCDNHPDTCLNTTVDPTGTNMSMGMQKIIFLIRGLLKEDSIVYIFDEPLSSVDPNSRKKVLQMINDLTKGKTLIIITHDNIGDIVNKSFNLDKLQEKDGIYLIEPY